MRWILFIACTFLCTLPCAGQDESHELPHGGWKPEPVELPRLGGDISPAEKTYFQLFRAVDGYRHAVLHARGGGGLRCILYTESDSSTADLNAHEAGVLAVWLRHYERLSLSGDEMIPLLTDLLGTEEITEKLRAFSRLHARSIIDVDRSRFEPPSHPLIVTYGGDSLRQPLLTVSENALFVWDGEGSYDAATVDRHLRRIPADSIRILEASVSLPFGPAAFGATYAVWSALMHTISRDATRDPKENVPIVETGWFLWVPAAVPGVLIGWLTSLPALPATYTTDEDSLAVKRGIPTLLPRSLFGANVPPEFHARSVAGDTGMNVYGSGDAHPYEYLPRPHHDDAWMLGLETLIHFYDVHKRPVSAHIALSLSRRIPLVHRGSLDGWYPALRPRISAGSFLGAELTLQLVYPCMVSLNAGIAYAHVFEDLGVSYERHGYGGTWTSSYERSSILQESFAVAGITVATSYGSLEFQYRQVLEPTLDERRRNYDPLGAETETTFDRKGFRGCSLLLNVRL